MPALHSFLDMRTAQQTCDIYGAYRLRYKVFVEESHFEIDFHTDHEQRFEIDRFDDFCMHVVLVDTRVPANSLDHIVGTARFMTSDAALQCGQFCAQDEFDLSVLDWQSTRMLEIGRFCVAQEYRQTPIPTRFFSWVINDYMQHNQVDFIFGLASFYATDPETIKLPLSYLYHHHRKTDPPLVYAHNKGVIDNKEGVAMNRMDKGSLDTKAAVLATPPLLKAYLRGGACTSETASIDWCAHTTDVLMMLNARDMSERTRKLY